MEDRYEIRGKIGQGGLGAVYRGFDTRMNREVAIKRISTTCNDPATEEESTRQLIKEAGALASLQHPHIVTVYDVGSDEDGPYVVMELISGKTLDELIEHAPLTWPDFRELAMQTQEALIAAQELGLIHSDLKPSNLMLTWLPSGKFQVKIVDFGLATLAKSQTKEDLEEMEAVFGSIFFMAPEQFERLPVDARSDQYSMGCVYYQALTGIYPFNGETGADVMAAHLNHTVTPIHSLRSDIPQWVSDWIMWQINRMPEHRPESARESLSVFLQNDKIPNPPMSRGPVAAPKRRVVVPPGAVAPPANTHGAARALTATTVMSSAAAVATPQTPTEAVPVKTAPQPLTPPEGSKPSVHSSRVAIPEPAPAATPPGPRAAAPATATATAIASKLPTAPAVKRPPRRKLPNSVKTAIAAVLGLLIVLVGWYLLDRSAKNRRTERVNQMLAIAAPPDATEVPVTAADLDLLLTSVAFTGMLEERTVFYKALFLARPTDGTSVDDRIAEFATTQEILPEVREVLIQDVLRKRANPSVVPTLIEFAKSPGDPKSAAAALRAIHFMATDDQFNDLVKIIESTQDSGVRNAAEQTLGEIVRKSIRRENLADLLATSYQSAVSDDARHAFLRLLGRAGGATAIKLVTEALNSTDEKDQIAAVAALSDWRDDSAFTVLADFIGKTPNGPIRDRAMNSAIKFASTQRPDRSPQSVQSQWTTLAKLAITADSKHKVINSLTNFREDWAAQTIATFTKDKDDAIQDLAEKALDYLKRQKEDRSTSGS